MKRALVIGDERSLVIPRLIDAGYGVIAMSQNQPMLWLPDSSEPFVHDNLRWHCFDVSDDRYLHGIENALGGVPVDVMVYLADPEHFSAVRAASVHLWGYTCVGLAEVSMLLKGLEAGVQTGANRG